MPKGTFERIPEAKRERILSEAAKLFAERGFAAADMDELVRRAGISKGSLYTYFEGKEELYEVVSRDGLRRSRQAVYGDLDPALGPLEQIEHIFRAGAAFATQQPQYVRLYLNVASAGLERFADSMSREVEGYTARFLKQLLRSGVEQGVIRGDLDEPMAACFVNDHYILMLASMVSPHFRVRADEYLDLGDDAHSEQLERSIRMIRDFLRLPGATATA